MPKVIHYKEEELSDAQGQEFVATSVYCQCHESSDVFLVFWPRGFDHPHVQCAHCEESYCLVGVCQMPSRTI